MVDGVERSFGCVFYLLTKQTNKQRNSRCKVRNSHTHHLKDDFGVRWSGERVRERESKRWLLLSMFHQVPSKLSPRFILFRFFNYSLGDIFHLPFSLFRFLWNLFRDLFTIGGLFFLYRNRRRRGRCTTGEFSFFIYLPTLLFLLLLLLFNLLLFLLWKVPPRCFISSCFAYTEMIPTEIFLLLICYFFSL